SGTFFVSETGHINYPFLGKIKVGGKKLEDVNKFIIASLKDGFFRNPMITVTFKSNTSQKITIYGNVNKPQIMPYQPEMTFLQAITMAGGLSKQAARDAITIMRKYKGKKFRVRISIDDIIEGRTSDFYLLPGDIIIVGESLL
ncbi:MAG: polysaccharide biosynthesis/export family protein, partial [Myxococcota bacterium]